MTWIEWCEREGEAAHASRSATGRNLSGNRGGAPLDEGDDVDRLLWDDHSAFGGGQAKHERALTRGAPEALTFVDAREQDALHHDHDHCETRHCDQQSQRTEQ